MNVSIATLNDLEEAVALTYVLHQNIETRCKSRPLNTSKEDIKELFLSYIERVAHDVLLMIEDNTIIGVAPIYWLEEDLYVSYVQGPYGVKYEEIHQGFDAYIKDNFKGYKLYANTPNEHKASLVYYEKNDYEFLEKALLLHLTNFNSAYINPCIQELHEENATSFYSWIDKYTDEDTYWNASRISKKREHFIILGYFDQGIKGHIIGRGSKNYTEIMIMSGSESIKEELLKTFITKAHQNHVTYIDLFTDNESEIIIGQNHGFKIYDSCQTFLKQL